jgi:uncharacterized protein (TIGR03435 family)
MQPTDDSVLLRQYVENNSDEAFAALVTRHINLVYSVALRRVANPHHAEEITHAVFIILARKAASLRHDKALSSWLFQATRLTAGNFIRSEIRRHRREEEAYMQSVLNETAAEVWPKIAPLLDDAVAGLREKDRQAIVLRFYEGRNLREVGLALGATEAAAEKRVNRALEKLRTFFTKRGVSSTTAILAGMISANSVHAAPVGLAKTISAAAIAKGATASTSTLTLIKGALKIMAWTKIKTVIVAGLAAILAIGTTMVTVKTVKHFTSSRLDNYFTHFDSAYLETAPATLVLRPSHYANQGDFVIAGRDLGADGKLMRRGCTLAEILSTAYDVAPEQMILPANLPGGQFDLLMTVSNSPRQALQAEIEKQFGLAGHIETRDANVLVLKRSNFNAPGLKADANNGGDPKIWTERGNQTSSRKWLSRGGGPKIWMQRGSLTLIGYKMSDPDGYDIAHVIGSFYNLPVIDETGLTGNFDIHLKWDDGAETQPDNLENLKQALLDQLGLELVPGRAPVEMLIVEKVK